MTRQDTSWDEVLKASARLQQLVPDAVLVGGSAAALHAGHRVSYDDDHVINDLRDRFGSVLEALEASRGWVTARVTQPVLILGSLEGVETGIRQLIRKLPLEIEERSVEGMSLRVPTLEETARIKGWLILKRNATRDFLDFVALADKLGADESCGVILSMDHYYEDQIGPGGQRISLQLIKQLGEPKPYDLSKVDLAHYRGLAKRWQNWNTIVGFCRELAANAMKVPEVDDEGVSL